MQRYVRGTMLEVLREDYIRTARAKGVDEKVVINKHAFRNTLIPVSTLLVNYFLVGMIGGSFILENIFSWPGLARLTASAALSQDIYIIMANLVIYTILGFIAYIVRDLVYAYVDPRVSLK
jgi:peptide/nickel transport system permease protein